MLSNFVSGLKKKVKDNFLFKDCLQQSHREYLCVWFCVRRFVFVWERKSILKYFFTCMQIKHKKKILHKTCNLLVLLHIGGSVPVSKQITRQRLSVHQKSLLHTSLNDSCYPNKTTMKELASKTGLRKLQVSRWFENKRKAIRKRKCKGTS